jgi:hypothetical protein
MALLFEFGGYLDEIDGFLETAVDARVPDVRHFVQVPERIHDPLADRIHRHFPVVFIGKLIGDPFHDIPDGLLAHGTLLSPLDSLSREKISRRPSRFTTTNSLRSICS